MSTSLFCRRPRAECVDVHRTHCRLIRRQPLCVHCSGHCVSLGSFTWWRKRKRYSPLPVSTLLCLTLCAHLIPIVLDMLEEIGTVVRIFSIILLPIYFDYFVLQDQIPHYITLAKSRTSSFRLWGFGHRVYKSRDPRAKIMQKVAHSVLSQIGTLIT